MQSLRLNPILNTDSYKLTHWWQYPPDTRHIYSYVESRGGMFDETMMALLQYIIKTNFAGPVFTLEDVEEARRVAYAHFGGQPNTFNYAGFKSLHAKHGGRLPLRIRAVKEGTVVKSHNALITIENTDPEFYWLTNWAETVLLQVWYPITVATLSRAIKQVIGRALVRTGDPSLLPFKLHDFGFRGVSSKESAAIGGAAHLFNFLGTDTLASIQLLNQFYSADVSAHDPLNCAAYSIRASEHSTVTAWGEAHEDQAYANILQNCPEGVVACVSDSYDVFNAVRNLWGGALRDRVLQRKGTLVIRPDSGDAVAVLEELFKIVADVFGYEVNRKGWKTTVPGVRFIQGDGVNFYTIQNITAQLTRKGWSQDIWGYGMGGALLQQLNRDTLKFALKCSAIDRGGVWHNVYKNPRTDPSKASKGGRFDLIHDGAEFVTVDISGESPNPSNSPHGVNALETVLEDGKILRDMTLQQVREIAVHYDTYTEAA
ncbi:MAG TPA: nicotinate phosphoribosyltransferase [Candidatus Acidoferrum sp.]|nr:nicotinate phosphoribosyltransferase [Candidatus Acidoferrum sp.]